MNRQRVCVFALMVSLAIETLIFVLSAIAPADRIEPNWADWAQTPGTILAVRLWGHSRMPHAVYLATATGGLIQVTIFFTIVLAFFCAYRFLHRRSKT